MGLLQKIGGRKFIMALIAGGYGSFLEIYTAKGLTPTMAGFLIALVGSFSVVNHLATKSYENSRSGNGDEGVLAQKIDELSVLAKASNDGEAVQTLLKYLSGMNESIQQVQSTAGQLGLGVVNLNKELQTVKRAVVQPNFT